MNKFNLFSNWVLGQGVELSDKTNIYQCMDLAYAYCLFLNIPKKTIQHLYAYEVFTSPNDITNEYFQILPNTPDLVPQEGDLGIFNKVSTNIAGHICVCTGEGDTKTFKSLDQNWAGVSKVSEVTHTYVNFLGVLRPKPQLLVITDQTILPIIDSNGNNMEVQAVRSQLADNEKRISNLLTEKDSLTFTTTSLNARISELEYLMDNQLPNFADGVIMAIHDVLYSKGFWFTKYSKIKQLLPK
jgi:hypothetical protein